MQRFSAHPVEEIRPEYSLGRMILYFLRLGAVGFGGPIALAGYMQRDLLTAEDG